MSLGNHYHLYANDAQLYLTFDIEDGSEAVGKMEHAISYIRSWIAKYFLSLNDDKTEVYYYEDSSIRENVTHTVSNT